MAETVAKAVPAPHHPDLALALFDARVERVSDGSIQAVLAQGNGGQGELPLSLWNGSAGPLECRVEPQWPSGWQGRSAVGTAAPRAYASLPLRALVPAGCWGSYTFPARVQLKAGAATLSWQETLTVGNGALGDWLVLGPELQGGAADPSFVKTLPGKWDFSKPVKFGAVECRWHRVTGAAPLPLAKHAPAPVSAKGIVGAYALCALEADSDVWVELTADSPTGGELQFYLDGSELMDLRMGRETWRPKRLPLKLTKGRHFILVVGRNESAAPGVSLAVRELGDPAGGHLRCVLPTAPK